MTSFIIRYLDWQAGNNFGSFAPDSDYPLTVCSREMRPLALLELGAFHRTNVEFGKRWSLSALG
jgi:hypothetical protein